MVIEILRFDGGLRVKPAAPYILDYLQYTKRGFKMQGWQKVDSYEKRLLYDFDEENNLYTMQGFFGRLVKLVEKNGDTLAVVDDRTPMPEPDWEAVKAVGPRDYQIPMVVEMLSKGMHDSGIVSAAGGTGKTVIQMMTYAAWNNLNTIVAIPYKAIVEQTYKKFKEYFPHKHVGITGAGYFDISKDITITTFKSLKNCATEKCDLLLVDELHASAGDQIQDTLLSMNPRRVFGFSATDGGLFSRSDKVLRGLFGERLIHVPYEDAQELGAIVPCNVYMFRFNRQFPIESERIETKVKRGIKLNKDRNVLVGAVCAAIPNNWQSMTFVETVKDHLIELMKYMPLGTRCVHRTSNKKEAGYLALTGKQQTQNVKDFLNNEYQHVVCSDCLGVGFDAPNCRVVIQASGGSSGIEVLQEAFRGSRQLTEENREALGVEPKTHFTLIDFLDEFDPALNSMANKRMEHYKKQGWNIQVIDSIKEIDWFTVKT